MLNPYLFQLCYPRESVGNQYGIIIIFSLMYKFICTGYNVFFPDHFIYLYVFILAVLGLRAACELFSRCATQPAHCSGFSCCGARLRVHGLRQLRSTGSGRTAFGSCRPRAPRCTAFGSCGARLRVHGLRQLQHVGLVAVVPRLRSAGSVAHRLSCSQFEPMPSALADGFFTTEPSGKP